jgi:DNA-directed RNA polymerase subunit beta'
LQPKVIFLASSKSNLKLNKTFRLQEQELIMASTTVGQILINDFLPPDMKQYGKPMAGKEMKDMLKTLALKHPTYYGVVTTGLKQLGDKHAYLEGNSFSYDEAKPVDVEHVYKKYEKEFDKVRKIGGLKEREDAQRAINTRVENEINNIVEDHMKTHPSAITRWSTVGGKGNRNNIRQMFFASGNQVDVANKVMPFMSKSNFSAGLSPSDAFISATGARKGIVESFISVRDPGALSKEFFMLTNQLITTEVDCGTHDGLELPTNSPDVIDRHLLQDYPPYHRNDVIDHQVQAALLKKHPVVLVRSPLKCKSKEGVCSMCIGVLENGKLSHVGDSIGLRSSQALTEKLTQMALSSKHTGGVVGKKSAFETVKQLMHVPENFPGGAVLAQVHGEVGKIEPTPDGGRHVYVGNQLHYLDPKQELLVKKGQILKQGDTISSGLINPAAIVRLKGMDAGRLHLARALQATYGEAGVAGHAKVFETVAKAMVNLGEVVDPGDHDFNIGDKVSWNGNLDKMKPLFAKLPVEECVGWRTTKAIPKLGLRAGDLLEPTHIDHLKGTGLLDVVRKPAHIQPVMYGTERAAIYGGDWISNLGFRFVKDQLKTNVAAGESVNLRGYRPVPSYVTADADFGTGPNGGF